jgi:hypothetical protein
MIWINDITKLQYYNPTGAPCYCDELIYPADLLLQGQLDTLATSGFTTAVYLYSADGLTSLGDITAYFEVYYAYNPATRKPFFNLRLKSFAPAMCAQACYILRVMVQVGGTAIFDSYTERYCQASCCDRPRGIVIAQEGIRHREDLRAGVPIDAGDDGGDTPLTDPVASLPERPDPCGESYITIRTTYQCYDAFSGDYYGVPATVYQGSASFVFEKRVNLVAKIAQREREIKREISYNCAVQRSESFKPYLLQGISQAALVPTWKMNEIENMFHAEHIYINDYINPEAEYQFAGGKIFTQVHKCWESFRLNATLQSCTMRQTFGCVTDCNNSDKLYFVVPSAYNGTGFYDESRRLIAYTLDELLLWAAGQNGVYEVEDISSDYPGAAGAFSMAATSYIPTSFYYDAAIPRNKIYGSINPPDASAYIPACAKPVTDDADVINDDCATPGYATPVITTQADSQATIYNINHWDMLGVTNQVTIYEGQAVFSIISDNDDFPATGSPLVPPVFSGEYIGVIGVAGRPARPLFIDHTMNENIPEGSLLTIDTMGRIGWYGPATAADAGGCKVVLNGVRYEL